jgi:hypothetical protein
VADSSRLTRNLTDWNQFEKACVRHGVLLSPYTGGDWTCPRQRAPITAYGGMETLRAKQESAVKSVRVRVQRSGPRARESGGAAAPDGLGMSGCMPTLTRLTRRSGRFCGRNCTGAVLDALESPRVQEAGPCACASAVDVDKDNGDHHA